MQGIRGRLRLPVGADIRKTGSDSIKSSKESFVGLSYGARYALKMWQAGVICNLLASV